jgi:hypothetical protein
MKNDFCDLPEGEIRALQIPNDLLGYLLSPFQHCKQSGFVYVPEESFKEMIGYIAQLAVLINRTEAKWARMDTSWLVDFVKNETKFDADLVERMLEFAVDAAKATQAMGQISAPATTTH